MSDLRSYNIEVHDRLSVNTAWLEKPSKKDASVCGLAGVLVGFSPSHEEAG